MFFRRLSPLVLLICSLAVLSACSTGNKPAARQVPEVLLGTDCGFDKLKCCATSPSCNYGQQCCVDPNDTTRNYCSENCQCGADQQFCCADNKCAGNAVCVNGLCSACGGKDQVCCGGVEVCSTGLVCHENKCSECGSNGEPCCSGDNCPFKSGERAECSNGICNNCGFNGNVACATGNRCLPDQIFTGKTCEHCGQPNQPCCVDESGANTVCDQAQGLACKLGFCGSAN